MSVQFFPWKGKVFHYLAYFRKQNILYLYIFLWQKKINARLFQNSMHKLPIPATQFSWYQRLFLSFLIGYYTANVCDRWEVSHEYFELCSTQVYNCSSSCKPILICSIVYIHNWSLQPSSLDLNPVSYFNYVARFNFIQFKVDSKQ